MKLDQLIRPNIKALEPYVAARHESGVENNLLLDANENPFGSPYNRYPDPVQTELRQVLAKQKQLSSEQICIGNGSDEIIDLLIRAFCEPGKDNILTITPTYGMYKVWAKINNVECRECVLNEDFSLNSKELLKKTNENTKIIFICSPNNPTGNSFDQSEIEELLNTFPGLIVVDEAYIDFSTKPSLIKRLSKYSHLFVIQTFSKSYGAAGLRLGMGYGSPEIITVLNSIKPPYNIGVLSQEEGVSRLMNERLIKENITRINNQKKLVFNALKSLRIVVKIFPSDANFWLVRFRDANLVYTALKKEGIIVRNRSGDLYCENALRITIGSREQNEILIKALEEIDANTI